MIKILVNDGIHPEGKDLLEKAGFEVVTEKVAQEDLPNVLPNYDAIVVRSATKVRESLIDQCPNLKVIARGGVGLDNIDVDHARIKGIQVMNTPTASSQAVAELAFAHMLTLSRSLHDANRQMPSAGDTEFKPLKKNYSKGSQLRGKTLGVFGFGNIGQETAKIALGMGMKVLAVDPSIEKAEITLQIGSQTVTETVTPGSLDDMLDNADYISLHVPFIGKPFFSTEEFAKMKDGVILVNCARGGTVDEDALLAALESGKVAAAGLDVFINEPTPRKDLLEHPRISLTPHIGASTLEAQANIGRELADQLIGFFK